CSVVLRPPTLGCCCAPRCCSVLGFCWAPRCSCAPFRFFPRSSCAPFRFFPRSSCAPFRFFPRSSCAPFCCTPFCSCAPRVIPFSWFCPWPSRSLLLPLFSWADWFLDGLVDSVLDGFCVLFPDWAPLIAPPLFCCVAPGVAPDVALFDSPP